MSVALARKAEMVEYSGISPSNKGLPGPARTHCAARKALCGAGSRHDACRFGHLSV